MLADFIVDTALGMAAVVSGITVTAAFAREWLKQTFAFDQFSQAKIEHASPVPVDQYDAQAWECAQQMGQRLQMKMPVDDQLRARQLRGQIIFPPEVLPGTGEHSLGVGAIAAEFARQLHDAFNIGACAVFFLLLLIALLALKLAQGFARQILDQNRVFFVRLIARGCRLKIKTYSTGLRILKLCQFPDLFARQGHT